MPSSSQLAERKIEPNTPLRLAVAAEIAFPDGSMTASGLRKEARRGRLTIERIAARDYTTLANIEKMRELCRVDPRASTSTSANANALSEKAYGSSSTETSKSALAAAKMS